MIGWIVRLVTLPFRVAYGLARAHPGILTFVILSAILIPGFLSHPEFQEKTGIELLEADEDQVFNITEAEKEIHHQVNRERTERGLQPLTLSEEMSLVAVSHSRDMIERDYYNHTTPEGKGPSERLAESGIHCNAGENLNGAWINQRMERSWDNQTVRLTSEEEFAEYVVESWMRSEGHREGILWSGNYAHGVGIYTDGSEAIITQKFCGVVNI